MASSPHSPEHVVARWNELVADESVPFPLQLLAEELGYTNLQLLRERLSRLGANPPRLNSRLYERDHAIGEVTFLLSAGRGVAEIASQLGTSAERLIERAHRWFLEGLVDFDLRTQAWTLEDEEWKSGEFALGPKARNGDAGRRVFKSSAA